MAAGCLGSPAPELPVRVRFDLDDTALGISATDSPWSSSIRKGEVASTRARSGAGRLLDEVVASEICCSVTDSGNFTVSFSDSCNCLFLSVLARVIRIVLSGVVFLLAFIKCKGALCLQA